MNQCRICLEEGNNLITPCECKGTSKYIHEECMNLDMIHRMDLKCSVCLTEYSYRFRKRSRLTSLIATIYIFLMLLCFIEPSAHPIAGIAYGITGFSMLYFDIVILHRR